MRLIDADALYERLKADEELARDRVIDTPNSFPNGAVNPSAIRYMAQLGERTRFKEMVYDAPTIDPVKHGKWEKISDRNYKCSSCGAWWSVDRDSTIRNFDFCPNCGASMKEEYE